jgi:hypothetical protein
MQRKEWGMLQEIVPTAVEQDVTTPDSSLLGPSAPAEQRAKPRVSRLARVALWLGIGTFLALVLMGLDGWLMSQGLLETHDLPEIGTWVLTLPTLSTLVLAILSYRRIAASGGTLTGRGLAQGSLWFTGANMAVLLWFASILLSSAGEAYMCGP